MDAGTLRHKIIIQKRGDTGSAYNEPLSWEDVKTAHASISTLSGKEFIAGSQEQSEVTHKVMMRYISGIKPSMRVEFGARHFDIMYIVNWQERNVELTLMCSEVF